MRLLAVAASLLSAASVALAVTAVSAVPFIRHPANRFDLSHKRLLFTPNPAGGYVVQVGNSPGAFPRGEAVEVPAGAHGPRGCWHRELGFPFPFGGKDWSELCVNFGGMLTFGAAEGDIFPELNAWPAGTMRAVAGGFDALSLAGRAVMIAPLWNEYAIHKSRLYANSSPEEFVATWDVVRQWEPNSGYTPLGRNFFQVRLTRGGAIEIRYGAVAERDGIVGVFSGQAQRKVLDTAGDAVLEDDGTALHIALKLPEPLPEKSSRAMVIGAGVANGAEQCQTGIRIDAGRQTQFSSCSGYTVAAGNSIDFYLSKLNASLGKEFAWFAGMSGQPITGHTVRFDQAIRSDTDLSVAHGLLSGNIYEVFHYPLVPKAQNLVYQELYRHVAPNDDLAVVMTDFRIDDLFDHGGGTMPLNIAIQGIGPPGANPGEGRDSYGSSRLQIALNPVYLGPRFRKNPNDGKITYRNYAFAVGWMAHELTHRWTAFAEPEAIRDPGLCCHWNDFLNSPVVHPVWQLFSDTPYPEASNMGGYLFAARADGAFVRSPVWEPAMGLSALDLYVMGLIPPEEVADTFLLTNAREISDGVFTGEKLPIRIGDLVKANGPRVPSAASSPREFKLGMYLLYDGQKPRADKLAQLQAIEKMLVRYFTVATGGRMKLVPGAPIILHGTQSQR